METMDKIINDRIKELKNSITKLKGTSGMNRDVKRENNKLTEYKISKLQTQNDAINQIEQICHTSNFGKIYTDLKKLIKLVDKYKHQATTYKTKYDHLSSTSPTNASTTPPTLVMGDHYSDQTTTNHKGNTQSDNSSK